MPIHIGKKSYLKFGTAVAAMKKMHPEIRDMQAYVATIERKQKGKKGGGKK